MKDHPPRDTAEPAAVPLLTAADLTKRFGGALAVDRVSLTVARGDICGLIGPNGAGKSTLFDLLAGAQAPTAGSITLCGRAVAGDPAHTRLAAGLGRTHQIPRPFGGMTVLENVMLATPDRTGERPWHNWFAAGRVARSEARTAERAMQLLEFVTLDPLALEPARVLSGGQRKLLDLARILMAEPAIILLDEPAAGVAPALLEIIIDRIATLNRRGTTFLIVEHNMELVATLCRSVLVMAAGAVLCEGTPQEVVRDPRVIEAYLGGASP